MYQIDSVFDEFLLQDKMKRLMFFSTGFEEQSLELAIFLIIL
jgi:hypothetical protein